MRVAAIVALLFAPTIACGNSRDVVPETHDVRVDPKNQTQDGYEYVARRPLGVVALAEGRGMPAAVAASAVDRVADQMNDCVRDQAAQNHLVPGAVRVVAQIDDRGTVGGLNISKLSQKEAAATAILCVIAPIRLLILPPADADSGARGIAIEATWGTQAP